MLALWEMLQLEGEVNCGWGEIGTLVGLEGVTSLALELRACLSVCERRNSNT